jgi:hypothetical protein
MLPDREPAVGDAMLYHAIGDPPGARRHAIVGRICGHGVLDLRVKYGTGEEGELMVRAVVHDQNGVEPRSWAFPGEGARE